MTNDLTFWVFLAACFLISDGVGLRHGQTRGPEAYRPDTSSRPVWRKVVGAGLVLAAVTSARLYSTYPRNQLATTMVVGIAAAVIGYVCGRLLATRAVFPAG